MGEIKRMDDIERENEAIEKAKMQREIMDTANVIKKAIFHPKKKEPDKPKSKWYKFLIGFGRGLLLLLGVCVILGMVALIKFCIKYIFGL